MTICSAYSSFFKNLRSCACNQANHTPSSMPLHLLLFKFSVDFVYLQVKSILANIVLCQKAGYIFPPYFWRFHCAELTLLPLMCLLNCLAASSRRCAASAATRPASAASTASAAAATRPPPAAPEGRMELEMACVFLTWKSSSLLGCLL